MNNCFLLLLLFVDFLKLLEHLIDLLIELKVLEVAERVKPDSSTKYLSVDVTFICESKIALELSFNAIKICNVSHNNC